MWTNSGIGELLVLLPIIAFIIVKGYRKGEIYFDTVGWEIKLKKETPLQIKRSPIKNMSDYPDYIISGGEFKGGKCG